MQLTAVSSIDQRKDADVIFLPFWQEKKHAQFAAHSDKEFATSIAAAIELGDFHGKEGETLLVYPSRVKQEKRILLLGLGPKKQHTLESIRLAYAAAVKLCRQKKMRSANVLLPDLEEPLLVQAVSEGLLLANYAFDNLKGSSAKEEGTSVLTRVCLIRVDKKSAEICKKTLQIVSAVNMTRDLVNGNADDVTPQELSRFALDLQKEFSSIKTTVLGKKEIEREKMGLLLAVNRGSNLDPALIILEYRGAPDSKERTAIVGKGITYDTGGLNIKPTGSMETMKCDMAGAAAVLGTLRAAAAIGLKANLIGVIPSTENAIGSRAYKPGDVYRSFSGKTVEISNTDAEGRLVLADALSYLQEKLAPTRIIDLATLTGGIVVALGEEVTGLFANSDALAKSLIKAGEKSGERTWRMPLFAEYREHLKSSIADIKNSAGKWASPITAAVFLKEFIKEGTPWAHLDIAGTAFLGAPKGYNTTHATGVGVRLLIEFLENA